MSTVKGSSMTDAICDDNSCLNERSFSEVTFSTILETVKDLVTARCFEDVIHRIIQRAQATLTHTAAAVYLVSDDRKTLHSAGAEGIYANELNKEILTFGKGILGNIAQNGKSEIIQDTTKDSRAIEITGTPQTEEGEKLMGAPLISGGMVIGVMAVWRDAHEPCFTLKDLEYLELLSGIAVIAIENARGYEEAQQRIFRLSLLKEIGRALSVKHSQQELVETIYNELGKIYDVTNFYIATYIEGSPTYSFAIHIENGKRVPLTSRQSDKGMTGYIIKTRKPLLMKNPIENKAFHEREGVISMGVPAVSWMGVPLLAGSELVGVMVIQSYTTPNLYDEHDLDFFMLIGTELAFAIQNARLYEAQQKAIAVAEDANKMKSSFLAKMSHELRTPLNAIINFAYLLNQNTEGVLNPGQAELIGRIEELGRHLLGLINDILDLAKIEAGKMELNLESVELVSLIDDVIKTAQALLSGKSVELNYIFPDSNVIVRGDAKRLRQVMLNLLSNAIKFTETGYIKVTVTVDIGSGMVTVSVSDTGRGISKENMKKIFMEFVQASSSDAARGSGLGLPISRHFIEMHGGTLNAESEPGKGSTFYFTLPIQAIVNKNYDEQIQISHSVSSDKTKVVIIDDDEESRVLLSRSLIGGRYNVVTLQDSRISLQTVKSIKPDVVLLDIMMPHADGWSILKALHEDPETKNIPVVICSILSKENKAVVIEASDYISKPIDPAELKEAIHKLASPGKTVLAIDDDPNTLEIIKRILDSIPLDIQTVQDGKHGLETITASPPGVVILDLMMPGLNGIQVLNELKKKAETKDIPVIVVTAKELNSKEREQIIHNTAALLQKGMFKPEELSILIESIIKKNKK